MLYRILFKKSIIRKLTGQDNPRGRDKKLMAIGTVKNFLRVWKITRRGSVVRDTCENIYRRRQFTVSLNNPTVIEGFIPVVSSNRKCWRRKLKNRVLTESNYLLPIPIHRVKKKKLATPSVRRGQSEVREKGEDIGRKLRFDFASVPSFLTPVAITTVRYGYTVRRCRNDSVKTVFDTRNLSSRVSRESFGTYRLKNYSYAISFAFISELFEQ